MANEEVKTEAAKANWIEVKVLETSVVRKEDKFCVIKVDGTHSTVLPTKMIRKVKDGALTFKFPDTFKFKVQERKQNAETKMYEITEEVEISAVELKARLG